MQHFYKFIFALALLVFRISPVQAQTTILDQTMLTQASFDTFTAVNVTGSQTWYFSAAYGAVCSGFSGGQSFENEDWLISPVMNLAQTDNAKLTFNHTRGNAAVMNVGVQLGWYTAFATANYTGNPATTQWVELQGLNQNIPAAWQYIPSGDLVIPASAKSATSRIAFRYKSSAGQSATWEIKNVKVTGQAQGTSALKVTNWNIEWFGCTTEAPVNDNLQMNNVVQAMLAMNSDIYCIQEVTDTPSAPTIQTLVSLLGSNEWGGAITSANTNNCTQRQGIIYKKSKVQFISVNELNNGNAAYGNSYYYNWSSGRFPAVYNVNVKSGNTTIPVSLVNIHAKSEDGDASSYTRRKGASEALKTILDGSLYNTKNVMVIGDFNDFLTGTSSTACNCTVSPYKNFIDDTANYTGITRNIIDVNTNWGVRPLIGNIIISSELSGNYVAGSAAQEVTMPQLIPGYYNTTSNHLPISAMFQFSTMSNPDALQHSANSWAVYPNPVTNELNITGVAIDNDTPVQLYDITGRQVSFQKISAGKYNVGALPAGMYIIKIGNSSRKFVKE